MKKKRTSIFNYCTKNTIYCLINFLLIMEILDLPVTFVVAIDENEYRLIHTSIDDEIDLIHRYRYKMASKNNLNEEYIFKNRVYLTA